MPKMSSFENVQNNKQQHEKQNKILSAKIKNRGLNRMNKKQQTNV